MLSMLATAELNLQHFTAHFKQETQDNLSEEDSNISVSAKTLEVEVTCTA